MKKRKTFLPSTVPATSWIEEKPQTRSDTATTNFILSKNNKENSVKYKRTGKYKLFKKNICAC